MRSLEVAIASFPPQGLEQDAMPKTPGPEGLMSQPCISSSTAKVAASRNSRIGSDLRGGQSYDFSRPASSTWNEAAQCEDGASSWITLRAASRRSCRRGSAQLGQLTGGRSSPDWRKDPCTECETWSSRTVYWVAASA